MCASRSATKVVLDDVSLDVAEHEVVCLIGASGSGKSTLLRCINLLEPIDDGAVILDDVDISEPGLDADPIRSRIGMVFQSYNLFPHMSVLRNITLAPMRVRGTSRSRRAGRGARAARHDSAWPTRPTRTPISCRAASSSASPSCARWRCSPRSCCSTRSPRRSTRCSSARCSRSSARCATVGHDDDASPRTRWASPARSPTPCASCTAGRILEQGPPEQMFTEPTQPETRDFLARVIASAPAADGRPRRPNAGS